MSARLPYQNGNSYVRNKIDISCRGLWLGCGDSQRLSICLPFPALQSFIIYVEYDLRNLLEEITACRIPKRELGVFLGAFPKFSDITFIFSYRDAIFAVKHNCDVIRGRSR